MWCSLCDALQDKWKVIHLVCWSLREQFIVGLNFFLFLKIKVDLGGAGLLLGEDVVLGLPGAVADLLRIAHTARPVSLTTASQFSSQSSNT